MSQTTPQTMLTRNRNRMVRQLQTAEAILKQAEFSPKGSDTCQVPFFVKSTDEEVTLESIAKESTPQYRAEVEQMANTYNFTSLLKYLYLMVGNGQREFVYRGLIFHSFERVKTRQEAYQKVGQDKIFDLAIAYEGMGWVYVLGFDTESQKYFVRLDGGSNSYDRDYNWQYFKSYVPSTKPNTLFPEERIFDPNVTTEVQFGDGSFQVVRCEYD